MRITESQLRKIVREEILQESADNRSLLTTMRKYKHPALEDKFLLNRFIDYASTVYYEFETRGPDSFKHDMESPEQFGQPEMPITFYVDLIAAMRRDEKSYWKHKEDTSYMPGYRD
jgi:hypothetical protein